MTPQNTQGNMFNTLFSGWTVQCTSKPRQHFSYILDHPVFRIHIVGSQRSDVSRDRCTNNVTMWPTPQTNCQEAGTPPGEVHERVTRIGEWLGNPKDWNKETKLLWVFPWCIYPGAGVCAVVMVKRYFFHAFLWVRNCCITSFPNFRDYEAGQSSAWPWQAFKHSTLKGCTKSCFKLWSHCRCLSSSETTWYVALLSHLFSKEVTGAIA